MFEYSYDGRYVVVLTDMVEKDQSGTEVIKVRLHVLNK